MSTWLGPMTRQEGRRRWRRLKLLIAAAAALLGVGLYLSYRYSPSRPVIYSDILEHFKYGSIGSDIENGLPLSVMKVLPRMFPEHLPPGGPRDYTAFGFIQEPGHAMPIGFSTRRRFVDLVGMNCAICHVGSVRRSVDDPPQIHLGMPSNTVDLQAFTDFLIRCAADPRFAPDRMIAEIEEDGSLFFADRLLHERAIPLMKDGLLKRRAQLDYLFAPGHPRFGPGRVDTFNPYKTNQFAAYYASGLAAEESIGTADFPSIWNQGPREGMHLHWDGDNTSVRERNVSAAFGAGSSRDRVDLPKIERIKVWLDTLPPPAYPFEIDRSKSRRGEQLYLQHCFRCHSFQGAEVGQVVPIDRIGTDRWRLDSYTSKLQALQLTYGDGYGWAFKHFKKTDGYSNHPLDGIWARAPYLHNGSVPTLWDLLRPAADRPESFDRGHDLYDRERVGFRADVAPAVDRRSFRFDTASPGNGNGGHTGARYGTELGDDDKRALIEYLKTL